MPDLSDLTDLAKMYNYGKTRIVAFLITTDPDVMGSFIPGQCTVMYSSPKLPTEAESGSIGSYSQNK